jgi:hypothetical protein
MNKSPEEELRSWQNSSIILSRAVSLLLNPEEALVVNTPNDESGEKKLIVFLRDEMIHIEPTNDENLKEGMRIKI